MTDESDKLSQKIAVTTLILIGIGIIGSYLYLCRSCW